MFGSEAKYDKTISTNASLDAVFIHQVLKDMTYKIQLSAHNRMGEGVRSDPIFIGKMLRFFPLLYNTILYNCVW